MNIECIEYKIIMKYRFFFGENNVIFILVSTFSTHDFKSYNLIRMLMFKKINRNIQL